MWKQRISTKKCCPCTVNIACHVKQSSKMRSFGGNLSWRWCGWKSSARVVQTATTRILRHRFPGTCETVGQVFKFVWRLHWKINVVCMSLSPFDSFQSRFVTYLLNRPRSCICTWTWISQSVKGTTKGWTFLRSHPDEIFHTRADRIWCPHTLLYNEYRVSFPGGKAAGAWLY